MYQVLTVIGDFDTLCQVPIKQRYESVTRQFFLPQREVYASYVFVGTILVS